MATLSFSNGMSASKKNLKKYSNAEVYDVLADRVGVLKLSSIDKTQIDKDLQNIFMELAYRLNVELEEGN